MESQKEQLQKTLNFKFESLGEAIYNLEEGMMSGKYVKPMDTNHINWRSGEAYNRMISYIQGLKEDVKNLKAQIELIPKEYTNYFTTTNV